MKVLYNLIFILNSLILISCDGLNSEIKSPNVPNLDPNQKPHCAFLIKNNCWQSSVEKILSCIDSNQEMVPEYFSDDYLLCKNDKGKTIRFENEFNPQAELKREEINFRIYNENVPCLQFIGNSSSFLIKSPIYGSISVNRLENGDSFISCLDGESFTLTQEIKEKGCYNQDEKIKDYIPGAQIKEQETLRARLFSFYILGDTHNPPLFSCQIRP